MNSFLNLLYHTTDPGTHSDCRLQVPADIFISVGVFFQLQNFSGFPNFSVLLEFSVFPGRGLNVCGRLNRPAMPNCHMHCYGHRFIS